MTCIPSNKILKGDRQDFNFRTEESNAHTFFFMRLQRDLSFFGLFLLQCSKGQIIQANVSFVVDWTIDNLNYITKNALRFMTLFVIDC